MSKVQKIWLIIAIALVAIGSLTFVGTLVVLDFDFTKLDTQQYETNTYEVSEDFDKISIDVATTNISFLPSDDGKCKVVCYEEEKVKHSVTVQNGSLVIKSVDTRKWYEHIGVSFESMKMTVYLPKDAYVSLSINTDTGNVEMPKDFVFESTAVDTDTGHIDWYASVLGTLEIETDTGKIQLTDVNCKSITAKSDTGGISLKNTIATELFSIESDTGNVKFEHSDAASIFVKTATGNVTGTLLSEKVFITETATGRIDVPKTNSGGRCEITTATGNIALSIN